MKGAQNVLGDNVVVATRKALLSFLSREVFDAAMAPADADEDGDSSDMPDSEEDEQAGTSVLQWTDSVLARHGGVTNGVGILRSTIPSRPGTTNRATGLVPRVASVADGDRVLRTGIHVDPVKAPTSTDQSPAMRVRGSEGATGAERANIVITPFNEL